MPRRLFGLFSKIRDKRVENPLGAGLGLAICKQLVELMRGQIHVASEYGRGTKFFFTVLVGRAGAREVDAYQQEAAQQLASADLATRADTTGKTAGRVLVVEDNEFNIEVVRCMLENAGHTVGLAMNGQDGLEAWNLARQRGDPYDVILMVRASSPTFRALSCPPFSFAGLLWPSHALLWPSHALL